MSRHFLIDGYNVTHKMPALAGRSLEATRTGLYVFLTSQRPQGSTRNNVTIVYDGREDVFWPELPGEVRVLFSKGESADDLIKRLISDEPSPREMVLVSDDRELQYFARACGVEVSSVESFVARGDDRRRSAAVRAAGTRNPDGKVISEVLKSKVNREFEDIWLKDH